MSHYIVRAWHAQHSTVTSFSNVQNKKQNKINLIHMHALTICNNRHIEHGQRHHDHRVQQKITQQANKHFERKE